MNVFVTICVCNENGLVSVKSSSSSILRLSQKRVPWNHLNFPGSAPDVHIKIMWLSTTSVGTQQTSIYFTGTKKGLHA